MPGESYRGRFRSLWLCPLLYVWRFSSRVISLCWLIFTLMICYLSSEKIYQQAHYCCCCCVFSVCVCLVLVFECTSGCWSDAILSSHLSLNREGRWGTTGDFATSFLHFSLFSTALWDLPNYRPVHSLMLSSHLFLCLPRLLPPFTMPCTMVLARPDERETWAYHCSLRLFTMVRRSSCGHN